MDIQCIDISLTVKGASRKLSVGKAENLFAVLLTSASSVAKMMALVGFAWCS